MKPELAFSQPNRHRHTPCETDLSKEASVDVPSMRTPAACSNDELLAEARECEAVIRRAMARQFALMAEVERRGLYG